MSRKGGPPPITVDSRQPGVPFCGSLKISCSLCKLFPHGRVNSQIVVAACDQRLNLFCEALQLLHLRGCRHACPLQRTTLDLLTAKSRSGLDIALGEQLLGYLEFAFSFRCFSAC